MKKILFTGLVMVALQSAFAQELIVAIGLSVHSLEKLKSAQSRLFSEYAVQLKSTQSFPPFLQYGVAMRFPLSNPKITLGGNVYGTSTAARSTYEDYSGQLEIDQRLRCIGFGFTFTYTLQEFTNAKLNLYTSVGAEFSTLKMDATLRLFNSTDNLENTYQAISPMGEVGLEYQYNLSQKFFLQGSGMLHVNQEEMLINKDDDTEYEYVNWTGVKLLIGIGYRF
jgi:hypothetical protein